MLDQICGERPLRIDLFQDPVRKEHVTVIAGIPVNDIPDLLCLRSRICLFILHAFPIRIFKTVINLDKQLVKDRQIIYPVFKRIWKSRTHLCIQHAQQPPSLQSESARGESRICPAVFIMITIDITVKDLIDASHLFDAVMLPCPAVDLTAHILQFQKKNRHILKIRQIPLSHRLFRNETAKSVNRQDMAFFILFHTHQLSPPINNARKNTIDAKLTGSPTLQTR